MHNHEAAVTPILTRQNLVMAMLLFVFFSGVYWLTYSGVFLSGDEIALFDGTESLARRGNTQVTYALNERVLRDYAIGPQPDTPLVDSEPMQMLLGVVLFRAAELLPGVGLVHAVWVLNVLVCAAMVSTLYLFARVLGYGVMVSLGGGALLGLGTIIWPYSKVFFREPLVTLLLFAAALCLFAWRQRWQTLVGWGWFGAFGVLLLAALLTKEAALLSLPIYVVIALPRVSLRQGWGRLAALLVLGSVVALVGFFVMNRALQIVEVPRSYDPIERLEGMLGQQEFIGYALASYLFSPGRSLFVFSPVLLLALPGLWLGGQARRWREVLMVLAAVVVFVGGYALLRHENWYGGLAWGPRYLVPLTPFLMLAVLPVLEAVGQAGAARWQRLAIAALALASMWVQLNGLLISQKAYYTYLEAMPDVVAWQEGTWQPGFTPLAIIPRLLATTPLDFAWLRVGPEGWLQPLGALLLMGLGGVGLRRLTRLETPPQRMARLAGLGGPILVALVLVLGLRGLYRDPVYFGDFEPLRDLLPRLEEVVAPEDIVVLTNPEYQRFMMNYYTGRALVYTLPMSPGEQPSPDQLPRVVNTNPDLLVEPRHLLFLDSLPEYTGRVWLLNNHGPFSGFAVRPVEWYMARHYFPLQTIDTGDTTRLIAFDVNARAPEEAALQWPAVLTDARFGEQVTLEGFDIPVPRRRSGPYTGPSPERATYHAGDVVPLSLMWSALDTPESDYNVGVFVIGPEGTMAEQHTAPQWGFKPMNVWEAGDHIRDNHGLQLPADLAPGEYAIWVKVYAWQTGEPLLVEGAAATADGSAALLTTVLVE